MLKKSWPRVLGTIHLRSTPTDFLALAEEFLL